MTDPGLATRLYVISSNITISISISQAYTNHSPHKVRLRRLQLMWFPCSLSYASSGGNTRPANGSRIIVCRPFGLRYVRGVFRPTSLTKDHLKEGLEKDLHQTKFKTYPMACVRGSLKVHNTRFGMLCGAAPKSGSNVRKAPSAHRNPTPLRKHGEVVRVLVFQ